MTNTSKPTLLVLAAGIGSRYGGLKQLDQLGPSGETIIDYSIYDAIRCGFGKVIFIIRKQIEQEFISFFGTRYGNAIEVDYVFQEIDKLPAGFNVPAERTKPWGTGHAVLMAKDKIKEAFAVINADDFYGKGAFEALAGFFSKTEPQSKEYALAGYRIANTLSEHGGVSRGVCECNDDGYLVTVTEIKNIHKSHKHIAYPDEKNQLIFLPSETFVSMNTWGFFPDIFEDFEKMFIEFLQKNQDDSKAEFYIPTVADTLIQSGKARFKVLDIDEQWFGVTFPEDRPTVVNKLIELTQKGVYPNRLW